MHVHVARCQDIQDTLEPEGLDPPYLTDNDNNMKPLFKTKHSIITQTRHNRKSTITWASLFGCDRSIRLFDLINVSFWANIWNVSYLPFE